MLNVLRDGSYRKHMEGLRVRLSRAMADVNTRLKNLGLVPWIEPQAGMFLWTRLPDGLDSGGYCPGGTGREHHSGPRQCLQPVAVGNKLLRFNVSQSQDDRIFAALRKAIARKR